MGIENILKIDAEKILVIEEMGKLVVNDDGKFSVIWIDNYDYDSDYSGGLFMREKDEESARALADMAATNAAKYNYCYEKNGETIALGREYYVYDSEGECIYTGQIKQNIIH